MLYTTPVVAQLIGEEPWYDLRQNRCLYRTVSYFLPPKWEPVKWKRDIFFKTLINLVFHFPPSHPLSLD